MTRPQPRDVVYLQTNHSARHYGRIFHIEDNRAHVDWFDGAHSTIRLDTLTVSSLTHLPGLGEFLPPSRPEKRTT